MSHHHHHDLNGPEMFGIALLFGMLSQAKEDRLAQEAEKRFLAERTQKENIAEAILALPIDQVRVAERVTAQVIVEEKRVRLFEEWDRRQREEARGRIAGRIFGVVFWSIVLGIGWLWFSANHSETAQNASTVAYAAPTPTPAPIIFPRAETILVAPTPTPVRVLRAIPVPTPTPEEETPIIKHRYVKNGRSASEQSLALASHVSGARHVLVTTIKGKECYWDDLARKWCRLDD